MQAWPLLSVDEHGLCDRNVLLSPIDPPKSPAAIEFICWGYLFCYFWGKLRNL
jgi:hypothetical protein